MALSIVNHVLAGVRPVPSPNTGGPIRPRFLVIHYTAGGPELDTATYFARRSARASAHLVVRRDGALAQCVPFNVAAWHAGKSRWIDAHGCAVANLNAHAIGIEIENWGPLQQTATGWRSWSGQPVDDAGVIVARHKSGSPECGWEPFTPAQVATTVAAAACICAAYGIAEILGHDDIAPGRKSDPGPAWDMTAFRQQVRAALPAG